MKRSRGLALCAAAFLLAAPSIPSQSSGTDAAYPSAWPETSGVLSVLSYNIKGLPWPVASGREDAISAMGQQLASMRSVDAQPHIALLQEAFGDDARTIGEAGGYRYVVTGPSFSDVRSSQPLGQSFADAAQWIRGERSGSLLNSGLAILSDYPVIKIDRYAFPDGACAGYDCLAAKGVLVAWIDIPGADEPVAIVDSHLNSRRSTHVSNARADAAYAWQVAAVRRFLASAIPSGAPIIFGGDFNTGNVPARMAAVSQPLVEGDQVDSLRAVLANDGVISGSKFEARQVVDRNKDKILFRNGVRVALQPERAWVPFSLFAQAPLSDHAGFVVEYSIL